MRLKDIARSGLKGRKRDSLLLNIVIILSFTFITAAMIFQSSTKETKLRQRFQLYGEWNTAYLHSDKETREILDNTENIEKSASSKIIGKSNELGMIGTMNDSLFELGNFNIYKGEMPKEANEIALELNQMSIIGLEPEIGQKVTAVIDIMLIDRDYNEYNNEYYASMNEYTEQYGYYVDPVKYHETPFENVGDILFIASTDIIYGSPDSSMSPETIREKGFIYYQKATIKKEFVISAIIDTYSDKWDISNHGTPSAFITEESANLIEDAFYRTEILETADYEFKEHIFMNINDLATIDTLKNQFEHNTGIDKGYSETTNDWNLIIWQTEQLKYRMAGDTLRKLDLPYSDGTIPEGKPIGLTLFDNKWVDTELLSRYQKGNGILQSVNPTLTVEEYSDSSQFRINRFAYPDMDGSTEDLLTYMILAVIFLATTSAVFQIFLTQMKRRTRKIVLLKSIGSTNGQIVKIILWEGIYLLRNGLILGGVSGIGLAYVSIWFMNRYSANEIHFYPSYSLIVLGIVSGIVSLFIGIMIPMTIALKVPLIGTMSKPPKHKKIAKSRGQKVSKELNKLGKINKNRIEDTTIWTKKQSLRSISYKYFQQNKGKVLLPFLLTTLIISIALISLLLGFFSFDQYIQVKMIQNRPDYMMTAPYGEMKSKIPAINQELESITGVSNVDVYKSGKKTLLWYDKIDEDKIINNFYELLPKQYQSNHNNKENDKILDKPDYIRNAFLTQLHGVNSSSNLYQEIISHITVGTIDSVRFEQGEEVVLILPMYIEGNRNPSYDASKVIDTTTDENRMEHLYRESGLLHFTMDSSYKSISEYNDNIKVGDKLYLSSDKEIIKGDSRIYDYASKEVTVGGIIYYFEKEGLWPFSDSVAPYTIISSYQLVEEVYPASRLGLFQYNVGEMKSMVNSLYPTKFANTTWYIESDTKEGAILDSKLLALSQGKGFRLEGYRESNEALKQEGITASLIIGLLAVTSILITLIILYNTLISKVEQEQSRIGILQSIGITEIEFRNHYIGMGFLQGIIGVFISNSIIVVIVTLSTIMNMEAAERSFRSIISSIQNNTLYQYPWIVHIIISIVFIAIITCINYISSKRIIRNYPIDNIRNLNR